MTDPDVRQRIRSLEEKVEQQNAFLNDIRDSLKYIEEWYEHYPRER